MKVAFTAMTDLHLTWVKVFGTASTNYFVDTRTWSWYMLLFAPRQAISTALRVPPPTSRPLATSSNYCLW